VHGMRYHIPDSKHQNSQVLSCLEDRSYSKACSLSTLYTLFLDKSKRLHKISQFYL